MALGFRLTRLLTSTCSIYRLDPSSKPNSATKQRPDQPTYALVASNVPLYLDFTINDDDPGPIGRVKRRTMLTEDIAVMEASVDVKSQDLIRNTTPNNVNFGTVHRVMGRPRRLPGAPGRPVDSLLLQLMEEESPPPLP